MLRINTIKMIGWLIISIVGIILFIMMFKSQDAINIFIIIKKNLFLILAVLLIIFFSFSIYRIYSIYDVDLTSYDGIVEGGKLYFLWIKSLFANVGKITGYAVQQNWILNESINKTN